MCGILALRPDFILVTLMNLLNNLNETQQMDTTTIMPDQNTLEILDCVVEDNDSTVYRALYNGKPRHVRIWKSIPTDA